jgi:hypothetical protein
MVSRPHGRSMTCPDRTTRGWLMREDAGGGRPVCLLAHPRPPVALARSQNLLVVIDDGPRPRGGHHAHRDQGGARRGEHRVPRQAGAPALS